MFTVKQFCHEVDTNLNGFMANLRAQSLTISTENSYIEVSKMLQSAVAKNPAVANAYITSTSHLLVEYQLPQAPAFCDLVLLGGGSSRPQVIIIELKDFQKNTSDKPGSCEGFMWHRNQEINHPSDQVKSYVEYCRNFHSEVVDINGNAKADVCGCVFFTSTSGFDISPYTQTPNDQLSINYPLYDTTTSSALASLVASKITHADPVFATAFEKGTFVQNHSIMKQVAASMANAASSGSRPFVLIGNQRRGFRKIMQVLDDVVNGTHNIANLPTFVSLPSSTISADDMELDSEAEHNESCIINPPGINNPEKTVIVVQGPPGSGKSAIAINLLIEAIAKYTTKGNIFYVTTSNSIKDNWAHVFTKSGKLKKGMGIQKAAGSFKPKKLDDTKILSPVFPQYYNAKDNQMDPKYYEDYIDYVLNNYPQPEYGDNVDFLSIVDEAHALINPLSTLYTGHQQGFANFSGPQAYHIIRRSKVSVFFTDPEQSFRDYESTSIQDIKNLAFKLGARVVVVDLGKMQFRCMGSTDYMKWVDNAFTNHPVMNHAKWTIFDTKVFKYPSDLEAHLRTKGTDSVRLLSSYTEKWVSKKILHANHTPNVPYDFDLNDINGRWKKYWNNPDAYDIFVQATRGSMAIDPLCEVGCPYAVRGFDWDYVGVLSLGDLVWRKDKWMIDFSKCGETATASRKKLAKEEQIEKLHNAGWKKKDATKYVETNLIPADDPSMPMTQYYYETMRQAYRILLSRGIKGMYLCIPDDETRNHIISIL